jgi:hypothetical protein
MGNGERLIPKHGGLPNAFTGREPQSATQKFKGDPNVAGRLFRVLNNFLLLIQTVNLFHLPDETACFKKSATF